jgi:hypothetical protein
VRSQLLHSAGRSLGYRPMAQRLRLQLKSLSRQQVEVEVSAGATVPQLAKLVERTVSWAAAATGGVRSLVHQGKVLPLQHRQQQQQQQQQPPAGQQQGAAAQPTLAELGVRSGDVLICVVGKPCSSKRKLSSPSSSAPSHNSAVVAPAQPSAPPPVPVGGSGGAGAAAAGLGLREALLARPELLSLLGLSLPPPPPPSSSAAATAAREQSLVAQLASAACPLLMATPSADEDEEGGGGAAPRAAAGAMAALLALLRHQGQRHAAHWAALAVAAVRCLTDPSAVALPAHLLLRALGGLGGGASDGGGAAAAAAGHEAEAGGHGESLLHCVHWVAVPEASRARRVNRRARAGVARAGGAAVRRAGRGPGAKRGPIVGAAAAAAAAAARGPGVQTKQHGGGGARGVRAGAGAGAAQGGARRRPARGR